MLEKIEQITNAQVKLDAIQITKVMQRAEKICQGENKKSNIEFEQFVYIWTFWFEGKGKNIKIIECRIADQEKMLTWYIDMRE